MLAGIQPLQGVIELPVIASQNRLLFHDIGLKALIGQGEGGRNSRQASADDESGMIDRQLSRFQRFEELRLGDGHPHEILGLFRGRIRLVHMHPRVLIANVGHLEKVPIEPRFFAVLLE